MKNKFSTTTIKGNSIEEILTDYEVIRFLGYPDTYLVFSDGTTTLPKPEIKPLFTKVLCKFYQDFGRRGTLAGTFVVDRQELAQIDGKEIYVYEPFGKHSEVRITVVFGENLTLLSADESFVKQCIELKTCSGFNPFNYFEEADEEESYEDE